MRLFISMLASLALLGFGAAHADVVSVRTLPARVSAAVGQDVSLDVIWQVTFDAGDTIGAGSPGGSFVNAASGAPLGLGVPTALGNRSGGGTQQYPETVSIPGATLAAWQQRGVRRVGYRRAFISPASGRTVTGQIIIDLARSALEELRDPASDGLAVLRMELNFPSGKRIEIVERDAALTARLTLAYSGSGTLRGRWQVAEPGGGANAFFRTVSLVRVSLSATQRATLDSPPLPTNLSGRYAVRFCLEPEGAAPVEDCADSTAGVQTLYEVRVPDGAIGGLSPAQGAAGPGTVFRWHPVRDAAIYQVQILMANADGTARFVTGLLVPGDSPDAVLSRLTQSKLVSGQRYRWRITAHDADGHLLARSDSAEFIYLP
jgi:hypothetical protein